MIVLTIFASTGTIVAYEAYVSPDDRTDRWTSHSPLYMVDELKPIDASGQGVFANAYPNTERHMQTTARAVGWSAARVRTTIYGNGGVPLIAAAAGARP